VPLDATALAAEERLRAAGHEPPPDAEIADAATLAALREHGRAVRLGRGRHIHADALAAVRERVVALAERDGTITLAALRDDLGTSRSFAQALLEALDAARVTLRVGDERRLRRRASS
jgi:selenocysteine-specific elongation factor